MLEHLSDVNQWKGGCENQPGGCRVVPMQRTVSWDDGGSSVGQSKCI